jgi:hypothetical protein
MFRESTHQYLKFAGVKQSTTIIHITSTVMSVAEILYSAAEITMI